MTDNLQGNVLFRNSLGHAEFIKTSIRSIVCKFLNYCSLKHISNGEKQVAVFAFDFIGHQINLKGFYERQELVTAFQYLSEQNLINGFAADIGANVKSGVNKNLAALIAHIEVSKQLIFSEGALEKFRDSLYEKWENENVEEFRVSKEYGLKVANRIAKWMGKDNYKQTRTFSKFSVYANQPGRWQPA